VSRAAAQAGLLHERRLRVVDDFHHLRRPALAAEPSGQFGVRVAQHDHQTSDQPSGHDAHLLHHALFDPVEQFI